MRLSNATLSQLPGHIGRPAYDRSQVAASIVHLGVGAFHRAHQAAMTDAVLASGDLAWGIVGAGVVSADMKNALSPQDGLYTLSETGADTQTQRVIGAIVDLFGGPEDARALLAKMSDISTRIVSITVTEKGYYLDLASGRLQLTAPAIVADLANADSPKTMLGLIVRALAKRRQAGIPPFTVMSCDNLPQNGHLAKAAVVAFAREVDAELAQWIAQEVCFPSTMVDRITPATTDSDRARVTELIGMEDAWPVVTEAFCQWVIEDKFNMGRPDWRIGGAIFSDEIERWENMKLRCLNGAHSTLSYIGQLTGRETVAEAMDLPLVTAALEPLWAEIREVLVAPQGVDTLAYVESLKQRFRNPALKHRTAQIACDGSQKLPQRLLAPLRERIAAGLDSPAIATAVAAWMLYVAKVARDGGVLNDPLAAEIIARVQGAENAIGIIDGLLSLEPIFGDDLPRNAAFRAALIHRMRALDKAIAAQNSPIHSQTSRQEQAKMKMTFRWYGDSDPVKLEYIRQIPGMYGIVSAIYDVAVGEVWPLDKLQALKARIEGVGLKFEVVESVPVHEDIKLGKPTRDALIANFQQNIRNCAAVGVKVICYNFMPVFDWTRTEMAKELPDGSHTLAFDAAAVAEIDPEQGISLPGWDASYKPAELKRVLDEYRAVGEAQLWANLEYFLKAIIPVAEEAGVKMAMHPDDPPRPIFGLPRIVKNRDDLARLVSIVDSPSNGLTLCSGSLGADLCNNIESLVREFGGMGRIHFGHLRNVKVEEDGTFYESTHNSCDGSLDMAAIVKAYHDVGFNGYVRPDHGRMIWGETGKPGYGLYDRALGAVYLNGLWEAVSKFPKAAVA